MDTMFLLRSEDAEDLAEGHADYWFERDLEKEYEGTLVVTNGV
jgi:hypothetical protein